MKVENYYDMIKFQYSLAQAVILAIFAAVITIISLAFRFHTVFYIFIAFWLMVSCCVLFNYSKSTISFFWIYIYLLQQTPEMLLYIKIFLRCDSYRGEMLDNLITKLIKNEISHIELKKGLKKIVFPHFIPRYLGGYSVIFLDNCYFILDYDSG